MAKHAQSLVWIRRDLRLHDHVTLAHACEVSQSVAMVFVFDPKIIKSLPIQDRRLSFIWDSLAEMNEALQKKGSRLILRYGDPVLEIPKVAKSLGASLVLTHKDYEPQAKARDLAVKKGLQSEGISFESFKDQVIFEEKEVLTQGGGVFRVFTPYKNAWLEKLKTEDFEERKVARAPFTPVAKLQKALQDHTLESIGFEKTSLWLDPGEKAGLKRLEKFHSKINHYKRDRDFPSLEGTSGLSVHLRFGTISVRDCVRAALSHKSEGAQTWLSEIIWRDFYHMILDQNPHVVGSAYKKECEAIRWPGKTEHFKAWCQGVTGYPIIDAAMRHFNETGWMHNRLRMVVASFLTKDLLVDWRLGEKYFADHLLDFDLAANNGGWQWSASTGCDAQPYFRIFNPYSQSEKFDEQGKFIRSQIPELKNATNVHQPETGGLFGAKYPEPIVNHSKQRDLAIALFKGLK